MKVVYLGTDAMFPCFFYLLSQHEVMAVYTCGNKEDYFRDVTITKMAKEAGIPVHRETIDEAAERDYISKGCEIFISADYGRRIPVISEKEGFYGINIHTSLLPIGRSYCPVECSLESRQEKMGVTIHKLVYEFDRGDILSQKEFPLWEGCDSIDLYLKCGYVAREMLQDIMKDFREAWLKAESQREKGSYWKLQKFTEARLGHDLNLDEAFDIYRIYNRMTRVKLGEDVYFVLCLEKGYVPIDDDFIVLGKIVLYRLKDGHVRLILEKTEHPKEVWESKDYPFKFQH